MTKKPEAIAQIEAALTAGPTDGPWIAAGPSFWSALPKYFNEVVVDREGDEDDTYLVCRCPLGLDDDPESGITLDYIAACNPTAIREVLAHIKAQEAEIERLRDALHIAVSVAKETHSHWEQDIDSKVGKLLFANSKVGKLLFAMSGLNPGYDKRIDAIHAALIPKEKS